MDYLSSFALALIVDGYWINDWTIAGFILGLVAGHLVARWRRKRRREARLKLHD